MGDLIGEQVEGTLYYADAELFSALGALGLPPSEETAAFADLCRINALYMIAKAGSGHIGSSFSSLDLVAYVMRHLLPAAEAQGEQAGLYFSSKGHDVPGLYAALMATGQLPFAGIHSLRRLNGLPGHPDVGTAGIVTNTGSLGMGISKAKGMIRAHRARGERRRVVVLTGDGELQEGQIWESLAGAVAEEMDELLVIVDHNKLQSDTYVEATSGLGDLLAKFEAFGFQASRIDGHDQAGLAALTAPTLARRGRPQVWVADTIKGAGVSFMAHTALQGLAPLYRFHSGAPSAEDYQCALAELSGRVEARVGQDKGRMPPLRAVQPDNGGTQGSGPPKVSLPVAYRDVLVAAAERHPELTVLDADLAVDMGLAPFRERFPERFIECGIAEMDMVSQAGGLALQGRIPVCHSFACFMTTRANEHFYNNASEHTRVIYVAGLAGLLPAGPGHSHQGVRDVAALGGIPNMTCLAPTDPEELALALEYAISESKGPVYIRLCSQPVALPFELPSQKSLQVGRGRCVRSGTEGVLFAYGPVLTSQAYEAAERLAAEGRLNLAVYALPFVNRVDGSWLAEITQGAKVVGTLDDHYVDGAQGDRIAVALMEQGVQTRLLRFGVRDWPACGTADEVLRYHGLHADNLVEQLAKFAAC